MLTDTTADRIAAAALALFARQGVQKTNLAAVAHEAGVTRVTVYRYFGDRVGLVRAVCQRVAAAFQRAAGDSPAGSVRDLDARLARLGQELGTLPRVNLLSLFDEISRLYPQVYEEFRAARAAAVDRLLEQALDAARRDGRLRAELHPDVLRAIFWSSVIGLIENPALISANVPLAEVFTTVLEVFRYGILRRRPARRSSRRKRHG